MKDAMGFSLVELLSGKRELVLDSVRHVGPASSVSARAVDAGIDCDEVRALIDGGLR